MQIIGKTERGFILQADEYETARLVGFYSSSDCRDKLVIGADIKINAMYDQLRKIKEIKRSLKEISDRAEGLIEAVKIKSPIIEPIVSAIESAEPKQ